jgi:uncharacterized protein YsxB (DUF464 family)
MLNRVRVEGEKYLYRDSSSNAIINTNKNHYIELNKQAVDNNRIERLERKLESVISILETITKEHNK